MTALIFGHRLHLSSVKVPPVDRPWEPCRVIFFWNTCPWTLLLSKFLQNHKSPGDCPAALDIISLLWQAQKCILNHTSHNEALPPNTPSLTSLDPLVKDLLLLCLLFSVLDYNICFPLYTSTTDPTDLLSPIVMAGNSILPEIAISTCLHVSSTSPSQLHAMTLAHMKTKWARSDKTNIFIQISQRAAQVLKGKQCWICHYSGSELQLHVIISPATLSSNQSTSCANYLHNTLSLILAKPNL